MTKPGVRKRNPTLLVAAAWQNGSFGFLLSAIIKITTSQNAADASEKGASFTTMAMPDYVDVRLFRKN